MIMNPQCFEPGIYAILDDLPTAKPCNLLKLGEELLRYPISAMQIRAKNYTNAARKKLAWALKEKMEQRQCPIPLIINDDVQLAKALGCPLHIGQDDISIQEARMVLGGCTMIGQSTHTLEQAHQAQTQAANYIGFGPMAVTQSKTNALTPRHPELFQTLLQEISLPIVAIGGLNQNNIEPLIDMGFQYFAMIGALHDTEFQQRHLEKLTEKIRNRD